MNDREKIAVLATFAHEILLGAYEYPAHRADEVLQEVGLLAIDQVVALSDPQTAKQVVAYYNSNWTLTPRAYEEAKRRDPTLFADMKPAYAELD